MDLKTKLELGWKYLLLIIIAYGIFSLANGHRSAGLHTAKMGGGAMSWTSDGHMVRLHDGVAGMGFFHDGDGKDIRIEKTMVDGEEVVEVWIDGEKQDGAMMEMDGKMMFHIKDGETIEIGGDDDDDGHKVIIKTMKTKGKKKKDKN